MTLATRRADLAAAVTTISGITVKPAPPKTVPKAGDGWVIVQRLEPFSFGTLAAQLAVIVILGADQVAADTKLSTWAPAMIDAVTKSLPASGVSLEPAQIPTSDGGAMFAAVLTATLEV